MDDRTDHRPRAVGRPRDDTIERRVLEVVRTLLLDVGWDELSVRAVAARSGVGRATISRRWPSKAQLVLAAILGETPDLRPFHGVDRRGWLEWVVQGSREMFARNEVRAAIPGLLTAFDRDPQLRRDLWATFSTPPAVLFDRDGTPDRDGRPDEELGADDPTLDARALIALGAGAALFVSLVAADDDTDAIQRRIRDLLLRAIGA